MLPRVAGSSAVALLCVALLVLFGVTCMAQQEIDGVILFLETDLFSDSDGDGELDAQVLVFGQLTQNGVPVEQSSFTLGTKSFGDSVFMGTMWSDGGSPIQLNLDCKGRPGNSQFYAVYFVFDPGIDANGAQICYLIGYEDQAPTGIICYDVTSTDLSSSWLGYTSPTALLEDLRTHSVAVPDPSYDILRFWLPELPVDPPGEGHVGFF